MSHGIPVDDTLTPRGDFPVVEGPVQFKEYDTYADLPDPTTVPSGTTVVVVDEGYLQFTSDGEEWAPQGYGFTVPLDTMILGSLNGIPTWRTPTGINTVLSFSSGPTLAVGEGPFEIGQSVSPTYTYTLSRAVQSSFRPGQGLTAGLSSIVVDGVPVTQSGTTGTHSVAWATSDINATRTYVADVYDGLGVPLTATLRTMRRGAVVRIGLTANTATLTPFATLYSEDWETHTLNAAPNAPWDSTGNTGNMLTTIETTLVINTGDAETLGTYAPHGGTKMLCLAALNAGNNQVTQGNGRAYARKTLDLTAVDPDHQVFITFWKNQIGNDSVNFAGIDLDIVHNAGTTQVLHEETSQGLGWVQKSINLSAYIGQSITLVFSGYDDNASGDPVGILVDDIVVTEYTVALDPIIDDDLINQAWIDANMTASAVKRPITGQATASVTSAYTQARVLVATPDVLEDPTAIGFGTDLPFTLYKANVPYTNSHGASYNMNVYLSDPVGSIGAGTAYASYNYDD